MKKIITIALILASISGLAQPKIPIKIETASDEEYKTVLKYVSKNIGRKVGDGMCQTLIDSAIYQYSGVMAYDIMYTCFKGRTLTSFITDENVVENDKDLKRGDILVIFGMIHQTTGHLISHIMFILKDLGNNKYSVIDQNPNEIKVSTIDMNEYVQDVDGTGLYLKFHLLSKKTMLSAKKYIDDNKNLVSLFSKN